MCRFVLYVGPPIPIASLVVEPKNSLIHQSFQAREREEPLNGDGFGLAWYSDRAESEPPGLFRSTTPAWSNRNLVDLARMLSSHCILAHVRAASHATEVAEANCHPFRCGRYTMMHNGEIGGFPRVKRHLLAELTDASFQMIRGNTDSEHLFGLFLDALPSRTDPLPVEALAEALRTAIHRARALSERHGGGEASYLNIAVTDGRTAAVSRFTTDPASPGESLHVLQGRCYVCDGGTTRTLFTETADEAVLVSSERLSDDRDWEEVPPNRLVVIDQWGGTSIEAI
jgi:predicted glutamine amidotransferase